MKRILLIPVLLLALTAKAQTFSDGVMMPRHDFCTGFIYSVDSWNHYWEGSLKRTNDNIGTFTSRQLTYMGTFGITDKLNVIAMVPYVWNRISGGTLNTQQGIQDLTLGAKYQIVRLNFSDGSYFKLFGVGSVSAPLTNYTPDYLPISIGLQSKTLALRSNVNYFHKSGLYAGISGAYVFRSNITLDRPSYYTDGQLFLTNEVAMPNQFEFFGQIGYHKANFITEVNFTQLSTLGGGDIRRQDMPFASNRMNFSKLNAVVVYYLPWVKGLALRGSALYTVDGRNVGQTTQFTGGVFYTFHIGKPNATTTTTN